MKLRSLGRTGLRVSEYCLGTMTFGESWGFGADKNESARIVDKFLDAGGNFIDTADVYTNGEAESYLGEFIGDKRDGLVISTKYSLMTDASNTNSFGNHRKNLKISVEASLRRLNTDYIDILWIHAWYFESDVEDILLSLDALVREGKVLYWGISDAPAWLCSEMYTMARIRGWAMPFGIQVEYSLLERTAERELLPFAEYNGLGVLGWGPLAGGLLTGKHFSNIAADTLRGERAAQRRSPASDLIVEALRVRSTGLGLSPNQLAIRWIQTKMPACIPILGARTLPQLEDNLAASSVEIPAEIVSELDQLSAIDPGFPYAFLESERTKTVMYGEFPSLNKKSSAKGNSPP